MSFERTHLSSVSFDSKTRASTMTCRCRGTAVEPMPLLSMRSSGCSSTLCSKKASRRQQRASPQMAALERDDTDLDLLPCLAEGGERVDGSWGWCRLATEQASEDLLCERSRRAGELVSRQGQAGETVRASAADLHALSCLRERARGVGTGRLSGEMMVGRLDRTESGSAAIVVRSDQPGGRTRAPVLEPSSARSSKVSPKIGQELRGVRSLVGRARQMA